MLKGKWKDRVMNFYDSVNNASFGLGVWANCPMLAILSDPSLAHVFFDDFHEFGATGDMWTIVEDGSETGTSGILDRAGGWIAQYSDGDANDEAYLATKGESWKFASGKPMWFETRLEWTNSATTAGNFIVGVFEGGGDADSLVDTHAGPPADYDGAVFFKVGGGAVINFETSIATTQVTNATFGTFVSGAIYRMGFYWDGVGYVTPYLDGVAGTAHAMATSGGECNIAFGCKSDGAEELIEVDYIKCVQMR